MPHLCLKVDVDTLRGTVEGVPRLIELFQRENVGATFLFSMGPDHTGRAIKRVFRPGFLAKVRRTSVKANYGLKTLMYGTLIPGPMISKKGGEAMRAAQAAGFECGVHAWDHVAWQDKLASASPTWAREQMNLAHERFASIMGNPARTCGAAGWQMSVDALRHQGALNYRYASDCRVDAATPPHPFWPLIRGEPMPVLQLPTTLPTLDELIGLDGCTEDTVHLRLLQETVFKRDHLFTLHAELEGMALLPVMQRLIDGWREQGYTMTSTANYVATLDVNKLPYCELAWGEIPGRSGTLLKQGAPYLSQFSDTIRKLHTA